MNIVLVTTFLMVVLIVLGALVGYTAFRRQPPPDTTVATAPDAAAANALHADVPLTLFSNQRALHTLPAAPPTRRATTGASVLVAEDDELNVQTLSDILDLYGYDVRIARDGLEAVTLADALLPDLVLMDIQMPRMDGIEAIQYLRVRERTAHIPIIALTGLTQATDRARILAAGATGYLAKPVGLDQLVTTIEATLWPHMA